MHGVYTRRYDISIKRVRMGNKAISPNRITYNSVADAYARQGNVDGALTRGNNKIDGRGLPIFR